jgi:hypothetical protein
MSERPRRESSLHDEGAQDQRFLRILHRATSLPADTLETWIELAAESLEKRKRKATSSGTNLQKTPTVTTEKKER